MAEKPNKTEQGRQKRADEKAARAAATQGRRDSATAAQERSEQRKGRNVDEGSASRNASFAAREAANGLTNTISGRVSLKATNPDFPLVGTPPGNDEFIATNNVGGGGGGGVELYAFKIIDDGDGTVSVTTGTVNTEVATNLTPAGKPTQLWLKATFDTDGNVTAASVQTSSGSTSATQDYRMIATITWSGNTPTIVQGIKGSQSIASCGTTHQWGTLYS